MRGFTCATIGLLLTAGCGGDDTELSPLGERPQRPPCVASIYEATDGECFGPASDELNVDGLHGPVHILRDSHGWPHIYAESFEDAFFAQGFAAAHDRMPQLQLLRRLAQGRLGEWFSQVDAGTVEQDILFRTIGLRRIAEQQLELWDEDSEERRALAAYARGVNAWLDARARGDVDGHPELLVYDASEVEEWTAVDCLTIGRLQTFVLSQSLDYELDAQEVVDGIRAVYRQDATDPKVLARQHLLRDLLRFAPADPATPLDGFPGGADLAALPSTDQDAAKAQSNTTHASLDRWAGVRRALTRSKRWLGLEGRELGSNNWVVAGSLSDSGHALLASDPHLPLSSPSILWPAHLVVENFDHPDENLAVAGVSFPGVPGVLLGFNEHVAWGGTVAFFDVTDVYAETLSADGQAVLFGDKAVALETVIETIELSDGNRFDYEVAIAPHHGPLLPELDDAGRPKPRAPGAAALSVRWVGLAPTREFSSVLGLARAGHVGDGYEALRDWGVGAQNWVLADSAGHILYSAYARIPKRDERALTWNATEQSGTLPCFVLPGDGTAEWTGFLEEEYIPHALDPARGWLATANTDQVGTTLDGNPGNDRLPNGEPGFLSCFYDLGFRLGRIEQRLTDVEPRSMTLDGMAALQGDAHSNVGARLAPKLEAILLLAEIEKGTPGSHPELSEVVASARYQSANVSEILTWLSSWREADYAAASGIDADDGELLDDPEAASRMTLVFNAWLTRLLTRVFLDELSRVDVENASFSPTRGLTDALSLRSLLHLLEADPASLGTYDPTLGDSLLWDDMDTTATETRAERFVTALLDALQELAQLQGADPSQWRWGRAHTVRFAPQVPLWPLAIPAADDDTPFSQGFPRHGDQHAVDASNYRLTRGPEEALDFRYGAGPVQRFVVELAPSGPRAFNVLNTGVDLRPDSKHFDDESELWRRNQNHAVPFSAAEVLADSSEGHVVLSSSP